MSTDEQTESVRVSFMCPAALAATIKAMSERSGVPLHVLLVHVCEQLARNGIAVKVEPIASVRAPSAPVALQTRTHYPPSTQPVRIDDDEDTETCKDCAYVLPLSQFTNDGKTHLDCPRPGAGLLAQRRAAGLPPLQ